MLKKECGGDCIDMSEGILVAIELRRLRFALYAHRADVSAERAEDVWKRFAESAPYQLVRAASPYRHHVRRGGL